MGRVPYSGLRRLNSDGKFVASRGLTLRQFGRRVIGFIAYRSGFTDTLATFQWDTERFKARRRTRRMIRRIQGPLSDRLHLGSGSRHVEGWINVDIRNSDVDVDLASAQLPFATGHFSVVCSQQTIEHLVLETELVPLLREVHRVMSLDGELWLSCPDIAKVADDYVRESCASLVQDRRNRMPRWSAQWSERAWPSSHFMNEIFHQNGQHKNLFDFELLSCVLERVGFRKVERTSEALLLERFPDFPARGDDRHALYVRATR